MTFVTVLLILVMGILAGMVFTYFLLPKESGQEKALERQLEEMKQSFDQYRSKVNGDYLKTANLLNQMTERYREVHQHLAESAEALCSDAMERPQLDLLQYRQDRVIESDNIVTTASSQKSERRNEQDEMRFH